MDVVEAARQSSAVAVERPPAEPGVTGPPIPGDHPVVQREAQERQVLVGRRDRRQAFEDGAEVVPDEADQPAEKRRRIGRERRPASVQPGDQAARHREWVRTGRGRLQHGHGIRGQVRPASIATGSRALEQTEPGQVPERLGDVDGSGGGDRVRQPAKANGGAGAGRRDHRPMIRPNPAGHGSLASPPCGREISASSSVRGRPGPLNAITDVAGVRVGHTTLIEGDGPLVIGRGPVRTGVTVVVPHDGDPWSEPVFAGCHRLNGNGELTGLEWIREAGMLTGPIGLTNTHSVGIVHDALIAEAIEAAAGGAPFWSLPVVGETCDGSLNDINGFHVRPEHVRAAIAGATGGPVPEGGVGGGTGMVCHEFKGGIGTASRVTAEVGGWTVGVLVQANYGRREWLRIDGVPVGEAIPGPNSPAPRPGRCRTDAPGAVRAAGRRSETGSIIVIVATDAPLLPHQCDRLAQRAGLGLARAGGTGGHYSGDLFLAWSTGNRGLPSASPIGETRTTVDVRMVADHAIDPSSTP